MLKQTVKLFIKLKSLGKKNSFQKIKSPYKKNKITQETITEDISSNRGIVEEVSRAGSFSNFSTRKKEESKASLIPDFIVQEFEDGTTEVTNDSNRAIKPSRNHHCLISQMTKA